jgi:hypothetical protein
LIYFEQQILSNEQALSLMGHPFASASKGALQPLEVIPELDRFYKKLSWKEWRACLHHCFVEAREDTREKILLWKSQRFEEAYIHEDQRDDVILVLRAERLIGRLEALDEEKGLWYLLEGAIPLEAIQEVRIHDPGSNG